MKRTKVDFSYMGGKHFTSAMTEAEDYADLVDLIHLVNKKYTSWLIVNQAMKHEGKTSKLLRGPGVARDAESIEVWKALHEAEQNRYWKVVIAAQEAHKIGTFNATSKLVQQVFKGEAANFLMKFGEYLLD